MSEARRLSETLEQLFVHRTGVFLPFAAATDGLSAAQAAAIPAPRFNNVWAVVNHVRYWQEVVLLHLRELPVDPQALGAPDPSGWPPAGDPSDEQSWLAARDRAIAVNRELAQAVAALDDDGVAGSLRAWGVPFALAVQHIIAHNSYHTCEIISIRHMQGLWLEGT